MTDTERLNWLQEYKADLYSWSGSEPVWQLRVAIKQSDSTMSRAWTAPTIREVIDKASTALPSTQSAPSLEPNDKGGSK